MTRQLVEPLESLSHSVSSREDLSHFEGNQRMPPDYTASDAGNLESFVDFSRTTLLYISDADDFLSQVKQDNDLILGGPLLEDEDDSSSQLEPGQVLPQRSNFHVDRKVSFTLCCGENPTRTQYPCLIISSARIWF